MPAGKISVFAAAFALVFILCGCGGAGGGSPAPAPASSPDLVTELPTYGPVKTRHLAGFIDVTEDKDNKLFYYFVEAEVGNSKDVPLLIWVNGGPGASSLTGLLVENLGPQKITADAKLVDNKDAITKKYHLIVVDNPVGSGYSFTKSGKYVTSEEEMRTQFVQCLRGFFQLHPEYKANPLWITGESYGGKYVPNIAFEIATKATDFNLQGVVMGNGLYNATAGYTSIGDFAFGAGVIDEQQLSDMHDRESRCLTRIASGSSNAGDFCENETVRYLYSPDGAGALFYYDIGMEDASFLDTVTDAMGKYLNRDDVKAALHVSGATWVQHDEVGPVAEHLAGDFVIPSITTVAQLLEMKKYKVVMYNGVRDGSVCNHIGNLRSLLAMEWSGAADFKSAKNVPWPSKDNVAGHIRSVDSLQYATILRTGHLVPTVVPQSFATLLDMVLKSNNSSATDLVV